MSGRMVNCCWAVLRGTEVAVTILKPFVHVLIPECMNMCIMCVHVWV